MDKPAHRSPGQSAWQECLETYPADLRQQVFKLASDRSVAIADTFYELMLAAPDSARFLDRDAVNERLRASMSNWIRTLFDDGSRSREDARRQREIGDIHARIGVSIELVARGARVLKRALADLFVASDMARERMAEAIQYANELVDIAVNEINASYADSTNRLARTDEAYRLFFLSQDMRAERERQKSHLLEWAHEILVGSYWSDASEIPAAALADSAPSPFAMWLQHKASILFDGAPEIEAIGRAIAAIERDLVPRLAQARGQADVARGLVGQISQRIEETKRLLGTMFDRFTADEEGHDSVTQLMNRRFFPTVAKREVEIALRGQHTFSLLLVEIDDYAALRAATDGDTHDRTIARIAEHLVDAVRAGDFVFRLGDDLFAVLLAEVGPDTLPGIAETLRAQMAQIRLGPVAHAWTTPTASIGAVCFDGHPDYQRMLERATAALEQARRSGGNRVATGY